MGSLWEGGVPRGTWVTIEATTLPATVGDLLGGYHGVVGRLKFPTFLGPPSLKESGVRFSNVLLKQDTSSTQPFCSGYCPAAKLERPLPFKCVPRRPSRCERSQALGTSTTMPMQFHEHRGHYYHACQNCENTTSIN